MKFHSLSCSLYGYVGHSCLLFCVTPNARKAPVTHTEYGARAYTHVLSPDVTVCAVGGWVPHNFLIPKARLRLFFDTNNVFGFLNLSVVPTVMTHEYRIVEIYAKYGKYTRKTRD